MNGRARSTEAGSGAANKAARVRSRSRGSGLGPGSALRPVPNRPHRLDDTPQRAHHRNQVGVHAAQHRRMSRHQPMGDHQPTRVPRQARKVTSIAPVGEHPHRRTLPPEVGPASELHRVRKTVRPTIGHLVPKSSLIFLAASPTLSLREPRGTTTPGMGVKASRFAASDRRFRNDSIAKDLDGEIAAGPESEHG